MTKVRRPFGYFKDPEGLKNAKKETIDKFKELGKTPHRGDLPEGIRSAIYQKRWVDFGVSSWQEFIEYCGLEPYVKKKENTKEKGYYKTNDGLQKAKEEAIEFYRKYRKTPLGEDLSQIIGSVQKGFFKEEGITNWRDFLIFCGLNPNVGKELLSDFPELLEQIHPTENRNIDPQKIYSQSNKKIVWKCPIADDHVWNASPTTRMRGRGCPFCANRPGYISKTNSLLSIFPEIAKEWDYKQNGDIRPENITYGSTFSAWWICSKCGYNYNQRVENRTSKRKQGCSKCKGGVKLGKKEINEIIGDKYGNLTFLSYIGHEKRGRKHTEHWYVFRCDCGKIVELTRYDVVSGNTNSCGCLKDEYTQRGTIFDNKMKKWISKLIDGRNILIDSFGRNTELPNGTYPDFIYDENDGTHVIGDFKYTTNPVNQDIPKYIDYCDRLEFWIKRSTPYENKNPKIVIRYYDEFILPVAKEKLEKIELSEFLEDMNEVEAALPTISDIDDNTIVKKSRQKKLFE